jgi:gamma-glutamyltranspeptidase/glutathione hydrolase
MWRQLGRKLPLFLALGLGACGGNGLEEGQAGFLEGFFGGIVVDEPRAALIGRDVLSAGGSAADAAVAAYFTLAVTMPGGASLGGGGVCLIHDRENSRVEAVEFLAGVPASGDRGATIAIPGNVRGMALVHARYGRLNWADLLVPAENFARGGHPISRAFARDLQIAAGTLRSDPEARRIFGLDNGEITEGRVVRQIELAAVLSVIRTRGAGEFYNGQLGRQLVEAIQQTGAAITTDDLRDYRPKLLKPIEIELGTSRIYFPPMPAEGGVVAAQLWAAGQGDDRYSDGDAGQRLHLLAEVAARAYAGRGEGDVVSDNAVAKLVAGHDSSRHQPASLDPGADTGAITDFSTRGRHDGVSLVAVDVKGQAVACSFTLNRPFGADKAAPGTGILLAVPATSARAGLPSAVIVANPVTDQVFFGAAMSGGSPMTLAAVALDTLTTDRDFGVAVTQARAYNTGGPDIMIAEPGLPKPVQAFLEQAGYALQFQEGLGRFNGFKCPKGLPREPTCQFVAEPRAHGLAVSADEK